MRIVLLTGTVGVGKSTVGFTVAERAERHGVSAGFIDVDALSRLWPAPAGDPFREDLVHANLRAMAPNYRAAGAALLVLAWVVDDEADIARLEATLGSPVTALRLVGPPAVVEARLRARHQGPEHAGLAWHLRRAPELVAIQSTLAVPTIDADGPPEAIADAVLRAVLDTPPPTAVPSTTA